MDDMTDAQLDIMLILEAPVLSLLELYKQEIGVGINTPLTREQLREMFATISAVVDEHEASLE